ncbi:procathepsin L-like [Argiope bruennichi]|uniref:Cathepsin L-like like protein n=1 Tax=Argiope bruennichi TaxID=94029 RepID=A0A8T0FI58_ARGBR|nr:procathepsin L-like [Argiope bruennichi]KAF8790646.1 Cathepsin L-like like protein [Argiope bruennichi]
MFRYLLLGLIVASVSACSFWNNYDALWENYKKAFNKTYNSSEEGFRKRLWELNIAAIQKHNLEADLKLHSFKLGINHFSDRLMHEYVSMNGLKTVNRPNNNTFSSHFLAPENVKYPSSVDWRKEGFVTEVKNQKDCGSCWAFSATGSLEGQHKRKTGKLVSLSEQNLIDCSTKEEGNEGCNGGMIDSAFDYIKKHGIDTEESYPYIAKEQKCHFRQQNVGATMTGYVDIPENDEEALKKAVATVGPVSVAINAKGSGFMFYRSGIYDVSQCDPQNLNHGVLVVGYGTENGKDYWIVKNSWGTGWGEDGYVKMARNKNMCGISSLASFPLV